MSIKKNVSQYEINYNSKSDSEVMKKLIFKQADNYFRTNDLNPKDVETVSFDTEHIVTSGETLSQIAAQYGLTYQELADYNNIPDPNVIDIGQVINIPTNMETETKSNAENIHQVTSGETLSQIASQYGLTYQELADYNHIENPNYIEIGQKIKIPSNDFGNQEKPNQYEKIGEDIKNISQKFLATIDSLAPILENKIKNVQNSFINNTMEVKDIIISTFKEIGVTINEEVINQIINNKLNGITDSNEAFINLTNQFKEEAKVINSSLPSITEKIKQAYQESNDKAINIKQIITDALKNINIQNIDNYIDILHYAFLKNSFKTEYVINDSIINQQENIAIPTHGEVLYEGDYLYLNSPDCDFKFKIPLARFEVDENDKKSVKIVELEGEKKEEYIKKAKQYITDYINDTKNFDYDFLKTLKNSELDKEIQILYLVNGGYSGMTVNGNKLIINGNTIVYDDEKNRQTAQKILVHELGHAYDAAKGKISKTEEWQEVYSQIHQEDYSELMSISMKGYKPNEWFARCVDNYYFYPERLTQIKINYGGYYNLYDYMKDLLSGK